MTWRSDHSFTDRLLHRLAFASWPIQAALADVEEIAFKARLAQVRCERPVFVAGLPRAGTTLILQLIEAAGGFASYRYRDMPFLLAPMLWAELTRGAARAGGARERAHGDGVTIDVDSPEAFEEVVWRTFHPERYRAAAIGPWPAAVDREFDRFFRLQMRKIIALRGDGRPLRYLSKNNGNIARLTAIARMFPDAVILVPYRDPLGQARSLLRQHLNFLALHAADPFTSRYMEAIGHYDFGLNLKPIVFSKGAEQPAEADFTTLDGWLGYWCSAYGHLAGQTDVPLHFVSYDRLGGGGEGELEALERAVGVECSGSLTRQAPLIRPAPPRPPAAETADPQLLRRARHILGRIEVRTAGRSASSRPEAPAERLRSPVS